MGGDGGFESFIKGKKDLNYAILDSLKYTIPYVLFYILWENGRIKCTFSKGTGKSILIAVSHSWGVSGKIIEETDSSQHLPFQTFYRDGKYRYKGNIPL